MKIAIHGLSVKRKIVGWKVDDTYDADQIRFVPLIKEIPNVASPIYSDRIDRIYRIRH